MKQKEPEQERLSWKQTVSVIIACYQVFLPILLCILAGLTAAFILIGLYL